MGLGLGKHSDKHVATVHGSTAASLDVQERTLKHAPETNGLNWVVFTITGQ